MLKTGKLESELLERIVFHNITFQRSEVITRPGIGEDCAVVDFGDYECVMSTDPITAAVSEIGSLAVHISCNDIASNGIEPLGIMMAVMLPEGTTEAEIEEMMRQAGEAAKELHVEIIGGHTEITPAVVQPVIVSTALGRAKRGASQKATDMRPGDFIYMTKKAGLEGTGIIACDMEIQLREFLSQEEVDEAKSMLAHVSVVPEGVVGGKVGTAGMHDITEGGILGAVWEMCNISHMGAEIIKENIPVAPVTEKICDRFGVNYLRLISSGCMLLIVHGEKKDALEEQIKAIGVEITCIGRVKEKEEGIFMVSKGKREEITPPESDELYLALSKAKGVQ